MNQDEEVEKIHGVGLVLLLFFFLSSLLLPPIPL
jgi:hypothetical protein